MTAFGKYHIIEADTLEACKYHRHLLEQALRDGALPATDHANLESKLKRTIDMQMSLQQTADEDEHKKKEGEGSQGSQGGDKKGGGRGDSKSAGDSHTSEDGREREDRETVVEEGQEDQDILDKDSVALLFFLADEIVTQPGWSDMDINALETAAAAALLYDKEDGIAHLHDSITAEHMEDGHPLEQYLPSVEDHASHLGAQVLQVKVSAEVVNALRNRFGYELYGRRFNRNGRPIQQMRKVLKPPCLDQIK